MLSIRDLGLKGEELIVAEGKGVIGRVAVVAGVNLVGNGRRLRRYKKEHNISISFGRCKGKEESKREDRMLTFPPPSVS
jgi:hypothetical protein